MQYRNLSLGFLIPTVQNCGSRSPEMEFLDISLTKDSSLLLYAIHSPSVGGFERKPYSYLVFIILTKICETRKFESIHE